MPSVHAEDPPPKSIQLLILALIDRSITRLVLGKVKLRLSFHIVIPLCKLADQFVSTEEAYLTDPITFKHRNA